MQTIKENRPDLDIDEYELDSLNSISLEDGGGNVSFVRKIDGIKTTDNISVGIIAGKAMSIRFYDTHEFVDFDETLLNFDKEEHEQMIQSFAEYVCNGYNPVSVENAKTTLVKEADGGYAIEYHLWITADTGEKTDSQEYFDFRISLR